MDVVEAFLYIAFCCQHPLKCMCEKVPASVHSRTRRILVEAMIMYSALLAEPGSRVRLPLRRYLLER
jgi:hypothetical protein